MAKQVHAGIEFTGRPTGGESERIWEVKSCPITRCSAVILSHQCWGTYVHYAGTRTRPCTGSNCDLCAKACPRRWEGYLAVSNAKLSARRIIRVTQVMSEVVDDYWRTVRSLRGHAITTWRTNGQRNGQVGLELSTGPLAAETLPDAPNIFQIMLRVWGLKQVQLPLSATTDFRIHKATGTDDALPD